jgi:hypothetical protein
MITISEVYKLSAVLDDPRFDGLSFARNAKSLTGQKYPIQDFSEIDEGSLDWEPRSLVKVWKPQPVIGKVRSFNDYPRLSGIPAFSRRAVECLRSMLESNGEILPLTSDQGEYFAYNIITKADVLDVAKSELIFYSENRIANLANYLSFKKTKLKGLTIFRSRELPAYVMVTNVFKERAEECGLNGLHFIKMWPYPKGVHWEEEERKKWRKRHKGIDLRGQSVILRYRLSGTKATAAETKLLDRYEHELNKLLDCQTDPNDPYYGTIEQVEFVKGFARILLSCGDAEVLVNRLEAWASKCDWPGDVELVKRSGNLFDTQAKEKRIKIK